MNAKLPLPKTKSKTKLMKEIDKQFPNLSNSKMSDLLRSLSDIVGVFKKVATEPQVNISSKPIYSKNKRDGKRRKIGEKRLIKLELVERISVVDKIRDKIKKR